MKIRKDSISKFIVVFLCVIYKILIASTICETNSIEIYSIIIAFFSVATFSIFNKKFNKKFFYNICIFVIFGIISIFKLVSVNYIFPIVIAIVFYDKENQENSYKMLIMDFLVSLIVGFLLVITLYKIGILQSNNLIRFKNGQVITRYSLGFSHPAFVGLYFTFILLAYYCLNKMNWINCFLMSILSILIYKICDSRTTLVCDILFIILLIINNNKFIMNIIRKSLPYLFVALTVFTILSVKLFKNYQLSFLDDVFSNRLTIYIDLIENRNILKTPFGIKLMEDIILDNYYLTIFMYFGYLGYILWAIFYYITSKQIIKNNILSIVQLIILIYGVADSNVIVTSINFMISIQFLILLYNKNDNKKIGNIVEKNNND